MGYTHYWYKNETLDKNNFKAAVHDFKELLPIFEELGLQLAGPYGIDDMIITDQKLAFNGKLRCGHKQQDLGITWPAKEVEGLTTKETNNVANGLWFAGTLLKRRACMGDCSHESFVIEKQVADAPYNIKTKDGLYFDCCKTAYKPYDIAVTVALVIFKHYFKDKFIVKSDGEDKDWFDAQLICQTNLNYGMDFQLDKT